MSVLTVLFFFPKELTALWIVDPNKNDGVVYKAMTILWENKATDKVTTLQ